MIEVAVKENLYLSEEFTRQFKREAAILASLRHPNLPKVMDHFEIPNQGQYLVMEFITGEDLRDRMDRIGTIPEDEVIHIGAAICDALTYLHTRVPAVVHRDIKPGNIRITSEGHILLVDFGLAKLHVGNQETTSGARAMTPGYSPPEQYGGSRTDPRSDIYSLGATLYAALCGMPPEDSLVRLTEFTKLTSVRSYVPKTNRRLALVIEKSLELKPDARFQTADQMKQALLEVIGEKATSRPIFITPPPADTDHALLEINGNALVDQKARKTAQRVKERSFLSAILITTLVILAVVLSTIYLYDRFVASPIRETAVRSTQIGSVDQGQPTNIPTEPAAATNQTNTIPVNKTQVSIVNPTQPTTAGTTPVPTQTSINLTSVSNTPPEGWIAFASNRTGIPQVWLMDTNGENQVQITSMAEGACQPDWSPDGKRIVFISPCSKRDFNYPKSNLYIIESDGTDQVALDTGFGGNYDPAWSNDGTRIAFTKEIQGSTQVFIYDLNANTIAAAIDDKEQSREPYWGWDDHCLAYIRNIYSDQVWVIDFSSNQNQQLTRSNFLNNSEPVLSPDGTTAYFTQSSKDEFEPRMVGISYDFADTTMEYRLPVTNHPIPSPAGDQDISPDGNWLVFESWPEGSNHDIYLMSITGEIVKRLTTEGKLDFQPSWSPSLVK
jgi:serine/threonine protein kinase